MLIYQVCVCVCVCVCMCVMLIYQGHARPSHAADKQAAVLQQSVLFTRDKMVRGCACVRAWVGGWVGGGGVCLLMRGGVCRGAKKSWGVGII